MKITKFLTLIHVYPIETCFFPPFFAWTWPRVLCKNSLIDSINWLKRTVFKISNHKLPKQLFWIWGKLKKLDQVSSRNYFKAETVHYEKGQFLKKLFRRIVSLGQITSTFASTFGQIEIDSKLNKGFECKQLVS